MLKRTILFYFCLLISHSTFGQDLPRTIDSLLNVHYHEHQFSGTVLVAKNGNIIYADGRGWAGWKEGAPLNQNTRFPVASITKAFTAVLIMQLVEQGQLRLDAPISALLPAFDLPRGKQITIHHLLTHTSGLPKEREGAYLQVFSPTEMIERYATQKPVARPGKRFLYNNLDFVLLGLIIEKEYGKPWVQVLQEKILTPLNMNDTGVLENFESDPDLATGYLTKEPAHPTAAPAYAIVNFYAAAGMYSTAADIFKFDQALYGAQLLSAASLERMYTSFPEFGYVAYGSWAYNYPFLAPQPRIIERRGGLPGFNHAFLRLIDDGHTIIILSNNDRFNPDTFGDDGNLKEQLIRLVSDREAEGS